MTAEPISIEELVYQKEKIEEEKICSIGILFGGYAMPKRVKETANLYKNERIKKIVATGGIGHLSLDRKTKESAKMFTTLVENGVLKKDIILEEQARNTYENCIFSLAKINEYYNLFGENIMLITSDFHSKRCLEVMKHLTNACKFYSWKVKDGVSDLENWHTSLEGKRRVYQEALSLCYYAKQERIENLEIALKRKR